MQLLGIGLGLTVALLWGTADTLAIRAVRRVGTFRATMLSQAAGLLMLFAVGTLVFGSWQVHFTVSTTVASALIGLFTGLFAALGYFALYRALEIGPVALVSPLTATSPAFTLLFAVLILQEHVSVGRLGVVSMILSGIVLASTSLVEVRVLLRKPGSSLWSRGVGWALVATFSLGAMDFGIGASASLSGWFLPVVWMRVFSLLFLSLIPLWKRRQHVRGTLTMLEPSLHENRPRFSLQQLVALVDQWEPFSPGATGLLLAVLAGIIDNAAVLTFSFDTRIASTGITSAIASSYALVVMVIGMVVCHERLTKQQLMGISMFMAGLMVLAV
jgi:drug/metabolite transporter (DMT)-like permease